ncbi:MAG TPA: 50S ribosome-binding GTPase [Sedimentisphaerales bacterium]|jgi:tRNA modification GTPase|nr:50S ribosome-binding GTPase [Sedimentisphaerales bacterium]HNU28607.1 50S ribosome-binding GTPase [Sedimentisphaerales bacterium]
MAPIAAVMTGRGAGAIATIQLLGDSAETVLRAVFRRADGRPLELATGQILLGNVFEGEQVIDQVTVGCEGPNTFAIHCHGNPLIVERIMDVLQRRGVQPVQAERLLAQVLTGRGPQDSIHVEATLALTTVRTVEGARIVANQAAGGLSAVVRRWQADLDSIPLERIAGEARQILHDSDTAKLILSGCTIVLIGPPNTGKSTLLNALAGREKAIVTEVPGTTRDWVSVEIHIPPLAATVIDTAGLDLSLAASGRIDQAAQHRSVEALRLADLVLLVLDASESADQLPAFVADLLVGRRVVCLFNKADLPQCLDPSNLPEHLRLVVRMSAKRETGIEDLIRAIHCALGLQRVSLDTAVVFTERQGILLRRLARTHSRDEAIHLLAGLLHGEVE